jgi:hypothetical protein
MSIELLTIEKNRMQLMAFIVVSTALAIQDVSEISVLRKFYNIAMVTGGEHLEGADSSLLMPLQVKRRGPYCMGVGHHSPNFL